MSSLRFRVLGNLESVPAEGTNVGYLWTDNWNDYWEFQTLYILTYFDASGVKHDVGNVKVGQFGMTKEHTRPDIPVTFQTLSGEFFSLGQDVTYYSALRDLGEGVMTQILTALNDVALNTDLYNKALNERVTGVSLLRSVSSTSIEGQFRRVIAGGAPLTPYSFCYEAPVFSNTTTDPLQIAFEVRPESLPPTNVHVIIGRNGVGKSHLLNGMARAIVYEGEDSKRDGSFFQEEEFFGREAGNPFAGVVSVTFSAFDDFELPTKEARDKSRSKRYKNIGLRKVIKDQKGEPVTITRDPGDLVKEFSTSAKACLLGAKRQKWLTALQTLETDSLFSEIAVADLLLVDDENFGKRAAETFRKLSSGHKIVLLTITQLVESVEERTLVLMDEPEAHLHPPLLSAFIRAISDLLVDRNGVAIIATHSPVILQEVPASCVWKIIRHGASNRVDRPTIETFAENVGILTSEVFGLEVTRSGFHKMIADVMVSTRDGEATRRRFDNEIGSEGQAIISSVVAMQRRSAS